MQITCIHVKCRAEVRHIVSSSTNPGVLFATCDEHVNDAHEFVSKRFMGRVSVSNFFRVPRINGWSKEQAA